MRYLSTRGHPERRRFCEILLEGLAPDGGLYLPESYPQVDAATLARWREVYRTQGYAHLAFEILSLYIDDIPADDLRALCLRTYTEAVFGTQAIVPVRELEPGLLIEALSNGPTLAFKDMAMQLLGHLFEYELNRRGEELNILGATSGDTGSAAEYAMRGKRGVRVFMTSPNGRMSPFQQAQMFSLQDANIHNLAIEGVFDDCQDIVKAVSNDLDFKRRYRIGVYRVRGSADTHETSSPSMDISKASNFERFVFDLLGRDAARTAELFGTRLNRDGVFDLSGDARFQQQRARYGFVSGRSTHAQRLQTIREAFERHGEMIDPHTADGVKVAREQLQAGVPMIVLETALPIKFAATLVEALGCEPDRPARFNGIEALPRRVQVLPADAARVKAFIVEHCA
jgi:threonine synthase